MKTENAERTKEERAHTLTVENRKRVSMTGVEGVISFSPTEIRLELADGKKLQVTGEEMKISDFKKSSGEFSATGRIDGVKYNAVFGLKGLLK